MKKVMMLVLCGTLAGLVFAAPDDSRFALVIGNASYSGDAALANPVNDATDVAASLGAVGWKVTSVINGDLKSMNRAIDKFHDQLTAAEHPTALLFYAGHGVQISGVNYLIPVKEEYETAADIQHYAVSLQGILDGFDEANVATNIVILDACRDNPFLKKSTRSLGGSRGLTVVKQSTSAEGSAIMFSTAPGETAADGTGRNGVFTQALLKYINTDLKLQDLATKVTGDVKKVTGGKQVPFNSISLSEDFYLVPKDLRDKMAPPPPAPVAASPVTVDEATVIKAGLVLQKQDLSLQRQTVANSSSWVAWLGWVGWVTAAAGLGASTYSYLTIDEISRTYSAARTSDLEALHNQAFLLNVVFKVGLSVAGGGSSVGLLSAFLQPDTSRLDSQLRELDRKISALGTN